MKSRKIRVNVINPGLIDTAALAGAPKELIDGFVAQVPMGRLGKPDEIAKAALFLASDDSSFVTGIERSESPRGRRTMLLANDPHEASSRRSYAPVRGTGRNGCLFDRGLAAHLLRQLAADVAKINAGSSTTDG